MNNIERIKLALTERKLESILITNPANRLFATGFNSSDGALLVTTHDAWFFTDSRYIEAAGASIKNANVLQVSAGIPYSERVGSVISGYGITSIGFEENSVTYSGYLSWKRKLKVKMVRSQKLLTDLRAVKSENDLKMMKKTQRIAEKSFKEVLPLINTGITEKELAAELVYRFQKNDADDKAFDPIVVSGVNSSMPHGVPGDVKIGRGFLTIDFGARYNGWCSDTTRTLCIGEPDSEMIRVYDTVLKAQRAGINAARAGVACKDVDEAARAVIEDAGYGENFGHGFGHGLGLEVHEAPSLAKSSKEKLPAGAVVSAEPGIYLPGRYGVRIEDCLFITESGNENITKLTKKLIII